jgi:type II secretory pathway pseudopilin PulG
MQNRFCLIRQKRAFTLIEIVATVAILMGLLIAGVSLLEGTGAQSRKASTDLLAGLIEKARARAINSRCYVILAIAEPGDLSPADAGCKVALFQLKSEAWPDEIPTPLALEATILGRWQNLFSGVALIGGDVGGGSNLIDKQQIIVNYERAQNSRSEYHALIFNPQGGLKYPIGSTPVVLRLAEGGYRDGKPVPYKKGVQKTITENQLKIGRVTGRSHRIDL